MIASKKRKCEGIRVDNYDGNPEGFIVVLVEGETLGQIELQWFVLMILTNLKKSLVLKKVHHLVYLSVPLTL